MAAGDSRNLFLEIDGSMLEGGGQILRMSTIFSVLLQKPIHVFNIRAGREKPGLRPQHMMGLRLVRDLCMGDLRGDRESSSEIWFRPGTVRCGEFICDTKTAGSITLLIQVSLPCLLFAPGSSRVVLKGGTHTGMAPTMDYLDRVFKPTLERIGIHFGCELIRRGYYPKGGGEVRMTVDPVQSIPPVTITEKGAVARIEGEAWVAGTIPHKACYAARDVIQHKLLRAGYMQTVDQQNLIQAYFVPSAISFGNEKGAELRAFTSAGNAFGASNVGKRGTSAEETALDAAEQLLDVISSPACVDQYMQDQLIVFMALASGQSQIRTGPVTLHTKTAVYIAELMTSAKFVVKEEGGSSLICSNGIGYPL